VHYENHLFENFFCFRSFDVEIRNKIDSLDESNEKLFLILLDILKEKGLASCDIQIIRTLYNSLQNAEIRYTEKNYLNHPLRVTASWLLFRETVSLDDVVIGLCHNLRESGKGQLNFIEHDFFSSTNRDKLECLTIDRSKERNIDYLKVFYDGIANFDSDLIALKGFDKLDNKLMYPLFDVEQYHFDVVQNFVCPRLEGRNKKLADYLSALARYVGSYSVKNKFRNGG
jgi:hypothetical protein